jgi:uroporphyrinogen-III synthase
VTLAGARVALLEARLSEELAALVRRHGGEPHCFPAVREEPADCAAEVAALLDELRGEPSTIFVFSTGVGATALFAEARRLGRDDELLDALRRGLAVCRGPKPLAALIREGLVSAVRVPEPYTTAVLLEVLAQLWLKGKHLLLLHYGERNQPLVEALQAKGARVRELVLYEWRLPEDLGPLRSLVGQIIERSFRAVAFTSQIQARHLFQVAAAMGRAGELREALRAHTLVAAVGPTCASALEELGAPPQVVPRNPKMGAMLLALADHFSQPQGGRI